MLMRDEDVPAGFADAVRAQQDTLQRTFGISNKGMSMPASVASLIAQTSAVMVSVREALAARDERLDMLSSRVHALEEIDGADDHGEWQRNANYRRGSFVTFDGKIWKANATLKGVRPGDGEWWVKAIGGSQ